MVSSFPVPPNLSGCFWGLRFVGSLHHINRHDRGGGLKQYPIAQADRKGECYYRTFLTSPKFSGVAWLLGQPLPAA